MPSHLTGQPAGLVSSLISYISLVQQSLSPAIVGANTTAEQIFPVTGLPADAACIAISKPTAQAGLGIVGARVSSAGNVAITFSNNTGAGITPTALEIYSFLFVGKA
jgi:hypothetical protein